MRLTGADILVECLIEQGVDTIFGFPGGAVLNIYDSLYKYKDKIKHYLTSHEQGRPMPPTAMRGLRGRSVFACHVRPGCDQPGDRDSHCTWIPSPCGDHR